MTTTVDSDPTQLKLLTVDVDPTQFEPGSSANFDHRAQILANLFTDNDPYSTAIRKIGAIADEAAFSQWQNLEGGTIKAEVDISEQNGIYVATTDGRFAPYADLIRSAVGYQQATFPEATFAAAPRIAVLQSRVRPMRSLIPGATRRHRDTAEGEWIHAFSVSDRSPTISWEGHDARSLQPYEIGFHDTSTYHAARRQLFGGTRTFAMMCFYIEPK